MVLMGFKKFQVVSSTFFHQQYGGPLLLEFPGKRELVDQRWLNKSVEEKHNQIGTSSENSNCNIYLKRQCTFGRKILFDGSYPNLYLASDTHTHTHTHMS